MTRALIALLFALLATPAFADGAITVTSGWARATPPGARTGAGYLTIGNSGTTADRLLSIRSPAAAKAEIHEMKTEDGVMTMRPATDGIAIPAGGTIVLAPNGYHIMFIRPAAPFVPGQSVDVTLHFATAGDIAAKLAVEPIGSSGPGAADAMTGMKMDGAPQ